MTQVIKENVLTLTQWIDNGNNFRDYLDYVKEQIEDAGFKAPDGFYDEWNNLTSKGIGRPCPACSYRNVTESKASVEDGRYTICEKCEAIYGDYWGFRSTDKMVKREWDDSDVDIMETRYFDFTIMGLIEGEVQIIGRRHGWFNPVTKKITQTG